MRRRIGILVLGLALTAPAGAVEPDTAIQQPSAAVMSSLTTVSGTAVDADGTIANVQVRLCELITNSCYDGTFQFDPFLSYFNPEDGWFNAAAADGTFDTASETWTDAVSPAALTGLEGPFVIQARAVDDTADTDSTPASKTFTIDATAPDTAVVIPPHGSSSLATTVITGTYVDLNISTIQVRVQDLSTGEYWNGGAGFGAAEFWSTATIVGPFFSQAFGATLVSGRSYNIVTKGFDTAGNVQSVFTVGFASTTFTHNVSPPSTASVTGLFVSSAAARWALVSGATGYSLIASTESANPPLVIAASSNTLAENETSGVLTGLSANTTYYFGVRGLGLSTATAYNQFAASATLANPPTTTAVSSVGGTTINLGWNANSNPSTTRYTAEISAASNFGSLAASSITVANSAQFTSLTPNTTYYLRVRAIGHGGTATAYDTSVTTATDAAAPTGTAVSSVGAATIDVGWNANSNPSTTKYTAEISAASNFGTLVASSVTYATTAQFTGLTQNTTYYLRVRAAGHGGAATAYDTSVATATNVNAPTGTAVSSVGGTTVNLGWNANSNPSTTRYTAEISAASNFGALVASSVTYATTAQFTGLTQDTTYYLRVRAIGHGGTATAYDASVTTTTNVSAPTGTAVSSVGGTTINLGWNANSNPGTTEFTAEISAASNFGALVASSVTYATTAQFTGLTQNTTYYLRVRAAGHGGTATAYDTSVTTATEAAAPTGTAVSSVGGTTVNLGWNANSNPSTTRYAAEISAASNFGTLAASSVTYATTAQFTGLTQNTTYYLRVRATGHGGTTTAYDTSVTTATDAAVPASPAAVAVSSTQIAFTWAANGNPSGTSYTAQLSTASDFSGTLTSSATLLTSATFFSLTGSTTYYARVKATSRGGIDTAFSASASTVTAVNAAPTNAISGTVTVNPNKEVNLVQITLSASGVANTTVFSDASGNWSFTGLSTDAGINYTIQASWKLSDGDATSIISQSGYQVGASGIAIGLGLSVTLGSITGTLSLPAATPAGGYAAASAAAVPSGAFVEIYRGQLAARVATDSQGRFTVPKLLPGTYQLRPYNGVAYGETTTVRLAEGESATVAFNNASSSGGNARLFDPKTFYFYPNPARNRTTIRFESTVTGIDAVVSVFDIAGSLVREFQGSEAARSGTEISWNWDLTNNRGQAVASGVYLVRIKVVDQATGSAADATKKLAVVR